MPIEHPGALENKYLQEYLPLLNTTFSSTYSESKLFETLSSKLKSLKPGSTSHKGDRKGVPIWAYERYTHR